LIVDGYTRFGGQHAETATLANVLAWSGVAAPHTGAPLSEAMLLGIGGGIGAGYWVFEYKNYPDPLFRVFTRHAWDSDRRFTSELCERLGVALVVKETGAAKAAAGRLMEALAPDARGVPTRAVIVSIDLCDTPDSTLPPELRGAAPHPVVVCGLDAAAGRVTIDDRAAVPWTMSLEALAASRASPAANKHRLMWVDVTQSAIDVKRGVVEGIRACHREMTSLPPRLPAWAARNCGLAAWAKWADLLTNARDKKGWPHVFRPGRHLFLGLSGIFRYVETEGAGGAFRPMYAAFLAEAAELLGSSALRDAALQFEDLGRQWTAFATAALPETVEPFRETRALLVLRRQAFVDRGAGAADELRVIDRQLSAIEANLGAAFPLDEGETRDLLADLSGRLTRIHEAERGAVENLRAAVA
jgi:hypothetical protein